MVHQITNNHTIGHFGLPQNGGFTNVIPDSFEVCKQLESQIRPHKMRDLIFGSKLFDYKSLFFVQLEAKRNL